MKELAAVRFRRSSFTHEVLDLVDAVSAGIAVKAIAAVGSSGSFLCCRGFGLATFAPYDCPIEYLVDIGELLDGIEPVAGNGEHLVGASEQFGCNLLAAFLM